MPRMSKKQKELIEKKTDAHMSFIRIWECQSGINGYQRKINQRLFEIADLLKKNSEDVERIEMCNDIIAEHSKDIDQKFDLMIDNYQFINQFVFDKHFQFTPEQKKEIHKRYGGRLLNYAMDCSTAHIALYVIAFRELLTGDEQGIIVNTIISYENKPNVWNSFLTDQRINFDKPYKDILQRKIDHYNSLQVAKKLRNEIG